MGVHEAPTANDLQPVRPSPSAAHTDKLLKLPAAHAVSPTAILVHCHLRWDFVWQRPQQILSRLAAHHPILFLEEAIEGEGPARLEITAPLKNIVRLRPVIAGRDSMSIELQCEIVYELLDDAHRRHPLVKGRLEAPVQWFYSPLTSPFFIDRLESAGIVYDCMDELANFRFAHADIADREKLLLSKADVVFTGGYRLYESKSRLNANTHFYGCGVDVAHFGQARLGATRLPVELENLPRPVFGYFGVIDERLDYSLIAHLAQTDPQASVVLVGPTAKVDPASLPRLPNIHWLGQRDYADLPSFVKGFDVCLMPFALNEATHYINPTKTLEYMAAAKPIVSTAVPDVVRNFTPVVKVAHSEEAFARAVREAAVRPDPSLIEQGLACAAQASWEAIVDAMRKHLLDAIGRGRASPPSIAHARAVRATRLGGRLAPPPAWPLSGERTSHHSGRPLAGRSRAE